MKTLPSLLSLTAALLLSAYLTPLAAQYNAPPPPEQQNTGEVPDQGAPPPGADQGAPPQMDQGAPPPGADQGAPPPGADDQGAPPAMQDDQGAPPPGADQGAPPPDAGGDQGAPPPDGAPDASGDANFQTFYDNLGSQGNWVQTDNYGYVWQPNESDPDWAPYTNGHWVYTDEGWTWVADDSEPWGWATYHYGRWANIDGMGWAWVPGYTWAPAWVSWRYGGGYCGWAPLPPDTFVGIDFGGADLGFHIGGDCDTAYGIGPAYYNFIQVGFIGGRDYRHHFANRNDNFRIINNTRNVTSINVNSGRQAGRFGRVSVGGPDVARINAESTTPIQRVALARSSRAGASSLSGNRLSVFAPHVGAAANGGTFHPRSVANNLGTARVNNGTNINKPLQVNSRVQGRTATPEQVAAATPSRFSTTAQIATPTTRPSERLTRPLSSFTPHTENRTAPRTTTTRTAGTQADSPLTGEPTARTGSTEVHTTGTPYHAPTLNMPPEHHDYTLGAVHPQQEHQSTPVQQRTETTPVQRTETTPVRQETTAPQEHHNSAPVQHEEHQDHHDSTPHSAPQTQHSAPQAQHSGGGGGNGGGNHSGGGGGGGGGGNHSSGGGGGNGGNTGGNSSNGGNHH